MGKINDIVKLHQWYHPKSSCVKICSATQALVPGYRKSPPVSPDQDVDAEAAKQMQIKLAPLRFELLGERARPFLDLFDEFVREGEFELALHAVCDSLPDQRSAPVDKSTIDLIRHLHAVMNIEDNCVVELLDQKVGGHPLTGNQ